MADDKASDAAADNGMPALWNVGIDGRSELERAIIFASIRGDSVESRVHLIELLRDGSYRWSAEDRAILANYLEGAYRNRQGRRPNTKRTGLEQAIQATEIQRAAAEVRRLMDDALDAGESRHGLRKRLSEEVAVEFNVSPRSIINRLNKRVV